MLRRIIRISICLAIFLLVLRAVGAREVIKSFANIEVIFLVGALALVVLDAFLRAANWAQLLNRFVPFTIRQACSVYLAGGFYGSLIPSSVGKDAARAMTVSRRAGLDIRVSAGTLVTLNLLGLGSVGALGMTAAIMLTQQNPSTFLDLGLSLSAMLVLGVYVLLFTGAGNQLIALFSKGTRVWPAAQRFLEPLFSALLLLPEGRRKQLPLVGIALVNQVIRVSVVALVAHSLGLAIDWWILAVVAPMAVIVDMIPLSFLGIGIAQGAMVFFLDHFGVASSDAFALSAMVASIYIGQALVGGVPVILDSVFGQRSG